MIQCAECELYEVDQQGRRIFRCDPFTNIKEPHCLAKWQLLRLDMLLTTYHSMTAWQQKVAPMQDKILKYIKRELEDIDEAERWKFNGEDDDNLL